MEIQLQEVDYRYSRTSPEVFHNLSWSSSSAEVIGLLGVNGSGKSTFLRLIGGMISPTSGIITLEGKSVTGISSVKEYVCYVPENAKLFLMGPTLRKDLSRIKKGENEVNKLLEKSGLLHLADKKLYALSEGQRRLTAIWLAFQLNRQIVLLDEPTIGMDIQGKSLFAKLLKRAVREGKIVIIASNDARILPLFDRISVIEEKCIKLEGIPENVLYQLEKNTQLIPNQVVRLISSINEQGANFPHYKDITELNEYLRQDIRREK